MKQDYIYIIIIIICWTINPFIKKIINKNISPIEYNLYNNISIVTILLLIFFYNIQIKQNKVNYEINLFNKLNYKEILLLIASSCITLLPSYLFVTLIKTQNISKINSVIQSSTIIASSLIGFYFFDEILNFKKMLGIINIVAGLFFILQD